MLQEKERDNDRFRLEDFRIPLTCGYSLFARKVVVANESTNAANVNNNQVTTLVVVHGGPGLSDHSESLPGLRHVLDYCGDTCCAIIFYDQLGCGASDRPAESDYSLSYYTQELSEVIEFVAGAQNQVGDDSTTPMTSSIVLLGHSWGGQVVLEYLLSNQLQQQEQQQPPRSAVVVRGAIISNTPLDEDSYEQKQQSLRLALDEATRTFLEQDERRQVTDGSVGSAIYTKLIGTSETNITGEMKGWSVRHRLDQLEIPCLFITGTFDTIPWQEYAEIQTHRSGLSSSSSLHQVCILEGGGHGPFFGDTAQSYFQSINRFLERVTPLERNSTA